MEEPGIPERMDEVTPEWLTAALRASGEAPPGAVATAIAREPLGEGEGFLGDIARLRPSWSGGAGPETLVAKLPKPENRALGELLGAYERESCFYAELAGELPLATPRLYYGAFDRDPTSERQEAILALADRTPRRFSARMAQLGKWVAGRKKRRYVLLLEDLGGAEPGDQVRGAPPERCAALLAAVARMHAAFWGNAAVEGRFWLLPLDIDARMRHGLFRESQPAFRKRFGHLLDESFARALAWTAEHGAAAAMRLQRSAPTTLLHCDLRLDNVAFRAGEPVVFDWQLARRGPAAYDVAYFLSGASPGLTRADEAELLRGYHAALAEHGVRDYPFAAFERDYRLGLLTALQTLATQDQIDLGMERGPALMEAWLGRLRDRLAGFDPNDLS